MKLRQPPADTCFCQLPKFISISQLLLSVPKGESGLNMQISTVENQVLKSSNAILIFECKVSNIWNVFVIVFEKRNAQVMSKQVLHQGQSNWNEGCLVFCYLLCRCMKYGSIKDKYFLAISKILLLTKFILLMKIE